MEILGVHRKTALHITCDRCSGKVNERMFFWRVPWLLLQLSEHFWGHVEALDNALIL
jgi:hypothetical protein